MSVIVPCILLFHETSASNINNFTPFLHDCTNVPVFLKFAQFPQLASFTMLSSSSLGLFNNFYKCNFRHVLWLRNALIEGRKLNIWYPLKLSSAHVSFGLEICLNRHAASTMSKHILCLKFSDIAFSLCPELPISWTKSKMDAGMSILETALRSQSIPAFTTPLVATRMFIFILSTSFWKIN